MHVRRGRLHGHGRADDERGVPLPVVPEGVWLGVHVESLVP